MIAFLEGILVSGGNEAVVAVGGGIGLDVQLSLRAAEELPAVGAQVRLWTHLAVREDHWSLYGFLQEAERAVFRLLISVAGIGPKVAMGMLSRSAPAEIARFLQTGDEKALASLPGIGKKSAARLVVELGERAAGVTWLGSDPAAGEDSSGRSVMVEALSVLTAMGLSGLAAEQALSRARQSDPDLVQDMEKWVRNALRQI